jgi:hypothetical protein
VYEEVGEVTQQSRWPNTYGFILHDRQGELVDAPEWVEDALSLIFDCRTNRATYTMPSYLMERSDLLALLRESVTAGGPTPGLEAYLTMMRLGGR